MGTSRWNRVEELFHEAADLSPGERGTFLQQVCNGDEELRREVESLLEKDVPEDEFRRGVVEPALDQMPESKDQDSELIGQSVGPYLITRLIGKGGMGAVYQAVRGDDFYMQVAVKLLKRGTDTESALIRFRSERQILAELQHPNIARLLDGGTTQSGLPYFVMEYVDGTPLLTFAATLSVHRRLELFISVCAAVHYAHQHHVVHRDIKPGNILVTQDGVPKLLDFGIAKLVDLEDSNAAPTMAGLRLMTPEYASPEQVRGDLLTAATDIYSLGAVLYELLTGHRPIHLQTRSPNEIEREICTREPKKPSDLNKELDSDLDKIVLMAMRKNPARRYQSAEDLADDLDRFLQDLPVKARKESVLYRTGKLLKRKRQLIASAVLPAFMVVTLVAVWGWLGWPGIGSHPPALRGSIVIADFINKTGDPIFDDTLKQGLAAQLKQSPFLDLVSESKVNKTLKLMGHPAEDRLTPEIAREVCQRTGSEAMLAGSIVPLGSRYVIGLEAVNCETGDLLALAQAQARGKEAVLETLGIAAVSLRSKLGESLNSVQKYATPIIEATTPSLEALKAYSLGQKTWSAKGSAAALPFFKRAVELDPGFAMAYAAMASIYANLGQDARLTENARKAYDLREKVSERERFHIEAIYYQLVTWDEEKAAQIYELCQQTYPKSFPFYANLGGVYLMLGQHEKALEEFKEAMRLEPNSEDSYGNLGGAYANLNRLDEAQTVYNQAEEHKLAGDDLLASRYELAFLKGDAARMAQLASAAVGKPGIEDELLASQAKTEAWYGRLSNARSLTQRAIIAAELNNDKETAADYRAKAALWEVESGNPEQARAVADPAKLSLNREVQGLAALALARVGDRAGAEKLAAKLDQRFPQGTLVQKYWLPTIRAAVALQRKDAKLAIEQLQVAREIELGGPGYLLPVYLRGEAYLMLRDGSAARAEFQKFIEHYGLVSNFPWGAIAWLGIARAYALDAGRDPAPRDKARAAYREFLSLWKDADPEVPILKQANTEYAKLH